MRTRRLKEKDRKLLELLEDEEKTWIPVAMPLALMKKEE